MSRGERIEIFTHCPLTPSSKRSLKPQGIKNSLNLNLKPITIFVAVSLTLILMASGLVIIGIVIRGMFFDPNDAMGYGPGPIVDMYSFYASIGWSGITLLAGLMIIKKSLNLHSRPIPIWVAASLILILIEGGLVIIWILVWIIDRGGSLLLPACIIWSAMTLLAGLMVLGPDVTGRIDRGQTGVREFNKGKQLQH